jgi:hypothetical protein
MTYRTVRKNPELIIAVVIFGSVLKASSASEAPLTFNKDIAPVVFQHCVVCHRPGQSAPFSLLTYGDAKKRAKQVGEVVSKHYMPPWLPEKGYGDFADDRSLSADEIARICKWVAEGAEEGPTADLLPLPKWNEGWQLGTPDLVVKATQPYLLSSTGKDVFRNLVIHIPTADRKFVRGVEFQPGNWKVVHHALMFVDPTPYSRRRAEKEKPAGFDGMTMTQTAKMPGGQFLTWQPGKLPTLAPEGLPWVLETNSDLVVQLHLHPSGKPEEVQPVVAFYFTDKPPTNSTVRINLNPLHLDIPPGATNYVIEDKFVLPIDADLLRLSPHAHYLAKRMEGYALLPDGSRKELMLIKDWDFNWQGDYRYVKPVYLPKGSTLCMRFTYDNSTNNVRNPNQPPRRVRYGPETTYEMAELWLQVLPHDSSPRARDGLGQALYEHMAKLTIEHYEAVLLENPNDAVAHTRAGTAEHYFGQMNRALDHLQKAVKADPNSDEASYELGFLCLHLNRLSEAQAAFENVVRLNPDDFQAEGSLGSIYLQKGNLEQAEAHFKAAVRINPGDEVARKSLEMVAKAKENAALKR